MKSPEPPLSLAEYLASIRATKGFSLREVEEATDSAVSNAYLSQLEHGKITKPSPNILHALAKVYAVAYEVLMEKAGYLTAAGSNAIGSKHGRLATFADKNLTSAEEEELLRYLGYLRTIRRQK
ncbi:MAG TPA: helix-turn-helix transcriptional regulator [Chthoniobacterales bacterium]|jgi:transcriptional regulator with XRE-family HTH domain|nr:helix-turn-helix transcriptional regulator [Chthoniobacterales bacterium]